MTTPDRLQNVDLAMLVEREHPLLEFEESFIYPTITLKKVLPTVYEQCFALVHCIIHAHSHKKKYLLVDCIANSTPPVFMDVEKLLNLDETNKLLTKNNIQVTLLNRQDLNRCKFAFSIVRGTYGFGSIVMDVTEKMKSLSSANYLYIPSGKQFNVVFGKDPAEYCIKSLNLVVKVFMATQDMHIVCSISEQNTKTRWSVSDLLNQSFEEAIPQNPVYIAGHTTYFSNILQCLRFLDRVYEPNDFFSPLNKISQSSIALVLDELRTEESVFGSHKSQYPGSYFLDIYQNKESNSNLFETIGFISQSQFSENISRNRHKKSYFP